MTKIEIEDQIQMWVELAVHKFNAKDGVVIMGECSEESVKEIKSLLLEVVEAVTSEPWDKTTWAQDAYWKGKEDAISEIKAKTSKLLG